MSASEFRIPYQQVSGSYVSTIIFMFCAGVWLSMYIYPVALFKCFTGVINWI
jgi:hypothetical protein